MRKTSQDGGDSTSITSGIENEIKKPGAIMKTKRNSLKRKVQNFSLESDDAVIEPLLQKDKEKTDAAKQSAKFNLMSKNKTETNSEKRTDKDKLMSDDKLQKAVLSNTSDVTDRILPTSSGKENLMSKSSSNAPLHNHMNTNMFSNHDGLKTYVAPKSQILVEIDGSKHVGYNPSPLIFTTAKIHTDGKTKHMEPVQMTPVPILSTIEVSMKNGMNTGETSGHVTSNISAVYIPQSNKHVREQDPKPPNTTVSNTTTPQNKVADMKIQILNDKIDGKSNSIDKSSMASSSNKEIKFTQPNITTDSVKDNFTSNKSLQNKTESQPSSSTSEKDKTIVPHEAKSVSSSIAFTKMANSSIKEAKTDKTDNWHTENKINLNETVKPEVLDLRRTKPSDHVNSLDKTSQDKLKDSANASFSNKQLQRQSIVLDKVDPMTKLKPNIVSPPKTNNSRGIHKCGESQKSSTIETNTLIDKTKVPKSSANSIQVTSVTSVSTDNNAYKAADNKIYASTTTAVTLNNKPSPITSNIAIDQTVASAINSAVTNNPTTTTSTVKNTSAVTNEVSVSTTTPALITTAVTDNKSSVPINTPVIANKTSTTNIVAPTKISGLSTITTSNKISSAVTSTATGSKLPSTSTPANKISNPMTTSAATNKMSSPSTAVSTSTKTSSPATLASNKISSSSSTNTASNKISSPSSTNTASNKLCNPITTTSAANKIPAVTSTINAASNKISPSSPTTTTGYKITDKPSSTTTADSKVPKPATTTATAVINKISAPSTTGVTTSKTSTASSTTTAGSKVSLPSITSTAGSKVSSPSTATTAASKKLPNPVITTTAIKITSGSTTTITGVDKTSTSNSNSSVPKTSSSSTLPQLSNTSITKSAIITTPSVSNPMNTEHHSSNISKSTNIKSGIPNETFTTTATAANTKPLSTTTTTKPAKVTTVATPTTTSQHTTVVKSPTVTTAKSVPTKTKPQLAVGKSNAITPKTSSTSNEKPTTAKASTTSISSTTTTGVSNTTTTAAAVSSGSSPATTEANKQSDSKSKVIGNGSKSFKA